MTGNKSPDQFAADAINNVEKNAHQMYQHPDGTLRGLTFEQAAAANQILALNAIAASLLAVADAINNAKTSARA